MSISTTAARILRLESSHPGIGDPAVHAEWLRLLENLVESMKRPDDRRRNLRFSCGFSLSLHFVWNYREKVIKGVALDVSCSGVLLASREPFWGDAWVRTPQGAGMPVRPRWTLPYGRIYLTGFQFGNCDPSVRSRWNGMVYYPCYVRALHELSREVHA